MKFTAAYLKCAHGFVGFVQELPGINAQGRTLEEAREMLAALVEIEFDEQRRQAESLLAGREVLRESFVLRAVA